MRQFKFICEDVLGSSRSATSRVRQRDFMSVMNKIKVCIAGLELYVLLCNIDHTVLILFYSLAQ